MSATAPTVPLPLVEEITHQTTTTPPPAPLLLPPPTSASLSGHWLSMDIKPQIDQAGTSYTTTPFDIQRYVRQYIQNLNLTSRLHTLFIFV